MYRNFLVQNVINAGSHSGRTENFNLDNKHVTGVPLGLRYGAAEYVYISVTVVCLSFSITEVK